MIGVVIRIPGGEDLSVECDKYFVNNGLLHLVKNYEVIMVFKEYDFFSIITESNRLVSENQSEAS